MCSAVIPDPPSLVQTPPSSDIDKPTQISDLAIEHPSLGASLDTDQISDSADQDMTLALPQEDKALAELTVDVDDKESTDDEESGEEADMEESEEQPVPRKKSKSKRKKKHKLPATEEEVTPRVETPDTEEVPGENKQKTKRKKKKIEPVKEIPVDETQDIPDSEPIELEGENVVEATPAAVAVTTAKAHAEPIEEALRKFFGSILQDIEPMEMVDIISSPDEQMVENIQIVSTSESSPSESDIEGEFDVDSEAFYIRIPLDDDDDILEREYTRRRRRRNRLDVIEEETVPEIDIPDVEDIALRPQKKRKKRRKDKEIIAELQPLNAVEGMEQTEQGIARVEPYPHIVEPQQTDDAPAHEVDKLEDDLIGDELRNFFKPLLHASEPMETCDELHIPQQECLEEPGVVQMFETPQEMVSESHQLVDGETVSSIYMTEPGTVSTEVMESSVLDDMAQSDRSTCKSDREEGDISHDSGMETESTITLAEKELEMQDDDYAFGIEPIELALKKYFDSLLHDTEVMETVTELEMPQEACIPDDEVHIVENFEIATEQEEQAHVEEEPEYLSMANITDFPVLMKFMEDTEESDGSSIPIEDVLKKFFESLLQEETMETTVDLEHPKEISIPDDEVHVVENFEVHEEKPEMTEVESVPLETAQITDFPVLMKFMEESEETDGSSIPIEDVLKKFFESLLQEEQMETTVDLEHPEELSIPDDEVHVVENFEVHEEKPEMTEVESVPLETAQITDFPVLMKFMEESEEIDGSSIPIEDVLKKFFESLLQEETMETTVDLEHPEELSIPDDEVHVVENFEVHEEKPEMTEVESVPLETAQITNFPVLMKFMEESEETDGSSIPIEDVLKKFFESLLQEETMETTVDLEHPEELSIPDDEVHVVENFEVHEEKPEMTEVESVPLETAQITDFPVLTKFMEESEETDGSSIPIEDVLKKFFESLLQEETMETTVDLEHPEELSIPDNEVHVVENFEVHEEKPEMTEVESVPLETAQITDFPVLMKFMEESEETDGSSIPIEDVLKKFFESLLQEETMETTVDLEHPEELSIPDNEVHVVENFEVHEEKPEMTEVESVPLETAQITDFPVLMKFMEESEETEGSSIPIEDVLKKFFESLLQEETMETTVDLEHPEELSIPDNEVHVVENFEVHEEQPEMTEVESVPLQTAQITDFPVLMKFMEESEETDGSSIPIEDVLKKFFESLLQEETMETTVDLEHPEELSIPDNEVHVVENFEVHEEKPEMTEVESVPLETAQITDFPVLMKFMEESEETDGSSIPIEDVLKKFFESLLQEETMETTVDLEHPEELIIPDDEVHVVDNFEVHEEKPEMTEVESVPLETAQITDFPVLMKFMEESEETNGSSIPIEDVLKKFFESLLQEETMETTVDLEHPEELSIPDDEVHVVENFEVHEEKPEMTEVESVPLETAQITDFPVLMKFMEESEETNGSSIPIEDVLKKFFESLLQEETMETTVDLEHPEELSIPDNEVHVVENFEVHEEKPEMTEVESVPLETAQITDFPVLMKFMEESEETDGSSIPIEEVLKKFFESLLQEEKMETTVDLELPKELSIPDDEVHVVENFEVHEEKPQMTEVESVPLETAQITDFPVLMKFMEESNINDMGEDGKLNMPVEDALKRFFETLVCETEPDEQATELEQPCEVCITEEEIHIVEAFEVHMEDKYIARVREEPSQALEAPISASSPDPLLVADIKDFPVLMKFMEESNINDMGEDGKLNIPIEDALTKFFETLVCETEPDEQATELEQPCEVCITEEEIHIVEAFEVHMEDKYIARMREEPSQPLEAPISGSSPEFLQIQKLISDSDNKDIEHLEAAVKRFFESVLSDTAPYESTDPIKTPEELEVDEVRLVQRFETADVDFLRVRKDFDFDLDEDFHIRIPVDDEDDIRQRRYETKRRKRHRRLESIEEELVPDIEQPQVQEEQYEQKLSDKSPRQSPEKERHSDMDVDVTLQLPRLETDAEEASLDISDDLPQAEEEETIDQSTADLKHTDKTGSPPVTCEPIPLTDTPSTPDLPDSPEFLNHSLDISTEEKTGT